MEVAATVSMQFFCNDVFRLLASEHPEEGDDGVAGEATNLRIRQEDICGFYT